MVIQFEKELLGFDCAQPDKKPIFVKKNKK